MVHPDSRQLRAFPGKAEKRKCKSSYVQTNVLIRCSLHFFLNGQVKYMYKTNHIGSNNSSDNNNDDCRIK